MPSHTVACDGDRNKDLSEGTTWTAD